MKRSEMIEHIAEEMIDAVRSREFSNETEDAYHKRKASYILDMLEGFGMLPPETDIENKRDLGQGLIVTYINKERKWAPESKDLNSEVEE